MNNTLGLHRDNETIMETTILHSGYLGFISFEERFRGCLGIGEGALQTRRLDG